MVPLGSKGGAGQMGWFTVGGFVVSKIKGGSLFFDKYVRFSASSAVADYVRTGSTRSTPLKRENGSTRLAEKSLYISRLNTVLLHTHAL